MFSPDQKKAISEAVQEILRATGDRELPEGEIQFLLHVDGAREWSWANIRNNGKGGSPITNPALVRNTSV